MDKMNITEKLSLFEEYLNPAQLFTSTGLNAIII